MPPKTAGKAAKKAVKAQKAVYKVIMPIKLWQLRLQLDLLNVMEVTGQAFEDMQEQNSRLIQQLREKDDANFKLMSERIKSNQIQRLAREERDGVRSGQSSPTAGPRDRRPSSRTSGGMQNGRGGRGRGGFRGRGTSASTVAPVEEFAAETKALPCALKCWLTQSAIVRCPSVTRPKSLYMQAKSSVFLLLDIFMCLRKKINFQWY